MADYLPGKNPFNADDSADYGSLFRDGWNLMDWQTWYFSNKKKYGQMVAKNKFVRAWNDHSFFSSFEFGAYSWAKYDVDFNEFLKTENIDLSNFIADVVVSGKNTVKGAGETLENLTSTTTTVTDTIKTLAPWLIVGAGLILLLTLKKRANV